MNINFSKRSLSLLVSLLILFISLPFIDITVSAVNISDWSSTGDGKENTPYIIKTSTQLINFAKYVNEGHDMQDEFIKLDDAFDNSTQPFNNRIGNKDYTFKGTFDGNSENGVQITLGITGDDSNYWGLFGYVDEEGTVQNVKVTGSVKSLYFVGGVCGRNWGTLANCINNSTVTGNSSVGGICGANSNILNKCMNTGEIFDIGDEPESIGGVCGDNFSGTLTNCTNIGNISVKYSDLDCWYVGGICGNSNDGMFINCTNSGNIVSNIDNVGGICGYTYNDNFKNCMNSGKVESNGEYVGAMCGENGDDESSFEYCYYDNDVCKGINGIGVGDGETIGLPTKQCKAPSKANEVEGEHWVEVDGEKEPLIDLLNDYVVEESTVNIINDEGEVTSTIQLLAWKIDTSTNTTKINKGYPYLIGENVTEIVNINLAVCKPSFGCILQYATATSDTANITVKVKNTTWFNKCKRVLIAKYGENYTSKVTFTLSTKSPDSIITDTTVVTATLNGTTVDVKRNADGTYTASYTFDKLYPILPILHISNILFDIVYNPIAMSVAMHVIDALKCIFL